MKEEDRLKVLQEKSFTENVGLTLLAEMGGRIVNGLTLILVGITAFVFGTGLGALIVWQGQISEGVIVMTILVFGSLVGVTALSCWCLGAWLKEQ
ncbi:MAG: hypothetical protein JSW05_06060 [Candidatus Thorarchaeota archaeon]|nr:MAG: hypothetical protein JSW05_06060 [Candidatus Thorarchaeota archaeon]